MSEQDDDHRIEAAKTRFAREYAVRWHRMLASWQQPHRASMMWLMYAANYLFVTHGVRWAVDPFLPIHLVPGLPDRLPTEALSQLSFVLLTHAHTDHVDYPLLASLRGTPVRLIIPEHMLTDVRAHARPLDRQVIVARSGRRLDLNSIGVLPFDGLHWQRRADGHHVGIDATGYLIHVDGQRWLFPGDVRDYRCESIAPFGPVDLLFAHLWLGRGCARLHNPPQLNEFCEFLHACRPRAVVLTHLYEFSRNAEDIWDRRHVQLVRARWAALAPGVPLRVPQVGRGVAL
jgi:hypothetical protein